MNAYLKVADLTDTQLADLVDRLSGGGYFASGLAECLRASANPMSTSLYALANAAMEWAETWWVATPSGSDGADRGWRLRDASKKSTITTGKSATVDGS